ncbi:MarR family winged helix-turn-helix transcriptional regulator [Siminovitchia sediminis]|uniref:MarR family winged helix-turn-helix transcriptional regulator n=1 Tax=Siminovitchia sediminis TaxID=1274353 RepID=A0ABW4KFQ9_9BACI
MGQDSSLKAFVILMKAAKSIQERVKQDMIRYGLNHSEFVVLEALFHKGPMTVRQICSKVLIASGSITYVIDKLEKKGMLDRRPCPDDRRVVHVILTDAGEEFMKKVFPEHQRFIKHLFGNLLEEEKERLIGLLKKVGHQASETGKEPKS